MVYVRRYGGDRKGIVGVVKGWHMRINMVEHDSISGRLLSCDCY